MTHVRNTNIDTAWCGEILNGDFYFKDIEQAAANGLYGDRSVCPTCVHKIIVCLQLHNKSNDL